MALGELVSVVATSAVLAALAWERWRLARYRDGIQACVHVAGSRGKSTVTRLIAAGLRGDGRRPLTKMTGMVPLLWFPSGEWQPVSRRGRVSIGEQRRLLAQAAQLGATALVVECMAIQPEYQWWMEQGLLCPTVTVITNATPDHVDVLGESIEAVAASYGFALMAAGSATQYITVEGAHVAVLQKVAQARQVRLHVVPPEPELAAQLGFFWAGAAEHVALALRAVELLGVSRKKALAGMREHFPVDSAPGGTVLPVLLGPEGQPAWFIDAFCANDPVSSVQVIRTACDQHSLRYPEEGVFLLFNSRRDRPERTHQWVKALVAGELGIPVQRVYLAGEGGKAAVRRLKGRLSVRLLKGGDARSIIAELVRDLEPGQLLAGVGNWHGLGRDIVQCLSLISRQSEQGGGLELQER